jgi:hypothetical protein
LITERDNQASRVVADSEVVAEVVVAVVVDSSEELVKEIVVIPTM